MPSLTNDLANTESAEQRSPRLCRICTPNALQTLPGPRADLCNHGSESDSGSTARMRTAFASLPGPQTQFNIW